MKKIALAVIIVVGFLIVFLTQSSSLDYRSLFISVLPLAGFQFCMAIPFIIKTTSWFRYAAILALIAPTLSLFELASRIWL